MPNEKNNMISIGALSRSTGIPVNTIRTWERRYGFPVASRTASGHRLYNPGLQIHLQLIASAIEQGHRPRQIMKMSQQELVELISPSK